MSTFSLTVSTPDGMLYKGDVQSLRLRTIDGDVGILANHENYTTAIGVGEAQIVEQDGTVHRAACIGGLLSMIDNSARVIATTFEWSEQIDKERALLAKQRAEERIQAAHGDKKELLLATAKLERALVRLQVKK